VGVGRVFLRFVDGGHVDVVVVVVAVVVVG
jgi:hypothetical protein